MQNLPRVLIVDDDPGLSRLARLILEQTERFEVCVENQALRAVETVRRFRPDVILMDVDMPARDGGEVVRDLRADPTIRPQPRILFFTALVSRQDAGRAALMSGGELYLSKPVDPEVLVRTVDLLLQSPHAAAGA